MHLHTEAQMALSTLPGGLPRTSVGKVRRFKL
jgi:hypothetical protein